MKRCPQCEFIYEDDQSLCDMDGALLVLDSRTLPNLHALAPVDMPVAQVTSKAHWRHRTFPAMAALILATVLSLVYFVSSQRGTAPAPVNVPSVTLPASNLVAPAEVKPTPEPPAATEANGAAPAAREESKPETKAPAAPAAKATSQTTSKTQPKPAQENKKDDSKVGSILKKTGRILKKPFKL